MATTPAPKRRFRPLSVKVVGWVLLFSTVFTVVMTAALIGLRYIEERDEAMAELQFAAASYRKSLANSLWDLDMPAAQLQLDALAHFPMVGHVVLTTAIGQRLHMHKDGQSYSQLNPKESLSWRVTLVSPDHPLEVGVLALYVDQRALLRHVQADALRILGGEAVKGLALSLLITWLISRLVTRHVSHIARHAAALQPNELDQVVVLNRRGGRRDDELDQLRDAINHLNRGLADFIARQHLMEEELRNHRDGLSQMVDERTRSLERLRGFHSLIIEVLTRFINLPLERTHAAVDEGLAAFGGYFRAERCLLFTRDQAAPGFCLANAWPPLAGTEGNGDVWLPESAFPVVFFAAAGPRVQYGVADDGSQRRDPLFALLATNSYSIARVDVQANTIGLLCLTGQAQQAEGETSLLELSARVAANMLDHKAQQIHLLEAQQALQQANLELHALSRHDPLTGLANRRYFDEIKDTEFRRAVRAALPLSVLMCDIDEFKRYNDHYGHGQGDRCLKVLSVCMSQLFTRAGELPARLGGEEFVVILPNTAREQALLLAERLRHDVWELNLPHAASSVAERVTISVGVACLKSGLHQDFDSLLHDADAALYQAKASNRNRVVMAD